MQTTNLNTISRSKQLQSPLLQAVLLIVVVVLFGWFIVIPKYNTVSTQRADLAELEQKRSTLEKDRADLNTLISKMKSSEKDVKLVDEALPLSSRPTRIALLLETFARSSGMETSQISINGLDKTSGAGDKALLDDPYGKPRSLNTVDVTVGLSGTIDQFKNFLTLLENSGRIVDVDKLEVTAGDTATTFHVNIKTYAFEPK